MTQTLPAPEVTLEMQIVMPPEQPATNAQSEPMKQSMDNDMVIISLSIGFLALNFLS